MNGNWATALTVFAKNPSPQTTLPSGVYLRHDEHTLTVFDGFPKGEFLCKQTKFHFLVLPRIPFKLSPSLNPSKDSKLGLAGEKLSFGSTLSQSQVPPAHLQSLSSLLASPYAHQVLEKLKSASEQVTSLIKEEMRATRAIDSQVPCGVEWDVRVGFHAVPSMHTVHLHVISNDLISDRLKNKKHYQSFHPDHGFWLDLNYIEDLAQKGRKSLPHSDRYYENLLKSPLVSFRDNSPFSTIPKLKEHLEQAWFDQVRLKIKGKDEKRSRSRDSSESENPHKVLKYSSPAASSQTESEG